MDALRTAIRAGDLAAVQAAVEAGADVNAVSKWYSQPLPLALEQDGPTAVDIIRYLLAHGADVNSKASLGRTTIDLALGSPHPDDIVYFLIEHGADVTGPPPSEGRGDGPLLAAMKRERPLDILRLLIARGARLDTADGETGWTPLILATMRKDVDVMTLLLDAGADINAGAPWGQEKGITPLGILSSRRWQGSDLAKDPRWVRALALLESRGVLIPRSIDEPTKSILIDMRRKRQQGRSLAKISTERTLEGKPLPHDVVSTIGSFLGLKRSGDVRTEDMRRARSDQRATEAIRANEERMSAEALAAMKAGRRRKQTRRKRHDPSSPVSPADFSPGARKTRHRQTRRRR
jgi:ankyrin repeat protein